MKFEDLDFFEFSDGQPHINLKDEIEKHIKSGKEYLDIDVCLNSADKLLKLDMIAAICRENKIKTNLILRYFPGRMDKPNSKFEPVTVYSYIRLINQMAFDKVIVYCPHSTSYNVLHRSYQDNFVENYFYHSAIVNTLIEFSEENLVREQKQQYAMSKEFSIVFPDKGCRERFSSMEFMKRFNSSLVNLNKTRDLSTGKITGLEIDSGDIKDTCIIVDDLCDGGATFVAAAKLLREAGAKKIGLCVFHGIFSKGTSLEGIDLISCTNSFYQKQPLKNVMVYTV